MGSRTANLKNLASVGKYLHSVDRYHVLRGKSRSVPRIGAPLFNEMGEKIGFVADVFGPVTNPYVLVKGKKAREYYARPRELLGVKEV